MNQRLWIASVISFLTMSACGVGPTESTPVAGEPAALSVRPRKCTQNVLCIVGDHWDPVRCKCVSDAPPVCISQEDGPCGGFTQNPCRCAPGLKCVPNRIPDIPGTCEPARCCPTGWTMYSCQEENGGSGFNCHNPQTGCPSSSICGQGCDMEVSGVCPVCDPIACPAGQVFSSTLCRCVGCNTAADCTGALPQLCEVCDDGSSACAHFACVNKSCQVAICNK